MFQWRIAVKYQNNFNIVKTNKTNKKTMQIIKSNFDITSALFYFEYGNKTNKN